MRHSIARELFAAVVVSLSCARLAPAQTPPFVVADAAKWVPSNDVLHVARLACSGARPKFAECVIDRLAERGAPPAAVAFATWIARVSGGDVGFLRELREAGRVDVAYVTRPLRANENDAVWLVNGRPDAFNVDDLRMLPQQHLARDDIYAALVRRHGEVTLWPGDRHTSSDPVVTNIVDGGQRFTSTYVLRKGCHACDVLGIARFAIDFDKDGRFAKASLVSVSDRVPGSGPARPIPIGPAGKAPARTMHVKVGETFTLALESEPSTAFSWRLAGELDRSIVNSVSHDLKNTPRARVDRGGLEVWTFTAIAVGTTKLSFESVKKGKVVRTLVYTIIVR